ncbi:MAG: MgtC/SapB family protein [Burkholderiales bacterium]
MSVLSAIYLSNEFAMLVKMLTSIVAGGVVGLERYQNGHPAGVRTFAIIEANFAKGSVPGEQQIFERFTSYGFNVTSIAFKGAKSGSMQVRVHVWTLGNAAAARSHLAMEFLNDPTIAEFSVEPVRE